MADGCKHRILMLLCSFFYGSGEVKVDLGGRGPASDGSDVACKVVFSVNCDVEVRIVYEHTVMS